MEITIGQTQTPPRVFFNECDGGDFDSWRGPVVERYYQGPLQIEDFLILNVEGERLLISRTWFPDGPEDRRQDLEAIFDTIDIQP